LSAPPRALFLIELNGKSGAKVKLDLPSRFCRQAVTRAALLSQSDVLAPGLKLRRARPVRAAGKTRCVPSQVREQKTTEALLFRISGLKSLAPELRDPLGMKGDRYGNRSRYF